MSRLGVGDLEVRMPRGGGTSKMYEIVQGGGWSEINEY